MSADKTEPCPVNCPFLKVYTLFEDAQMAHCTLFETPLVLAGVPRRSPDCLNAGRRKAQYQAKKMSTSAKTASVFLCSPALMLNFMLS